MTDPKPDLGADGPAALARTSYVATFRGQVMARTVASEPLEHWHQGALISDRQYEAGCRLRRAYHLSSITVTLVSAPARYASDGSDLDNDTAGETEQETYQRKKEYSARWNDARMVVGADWLHLRHAVCLGAFPRHVNGLIVVRKCLALLADMWKITA